MLIIPAIDIINGECVRLTQGDYASKKVYSSDPVQVAKRFEDEGADMLHIVDLDGAKSGKPENFDLVTSIRKAIVTPIEVGGGIRNFETIERYFSIGINRVILGTKAIEDQDFLRQCVQRFGDKIVVGLDVRDGKVAIQGWLATSDQSPLAFAETLQKLGVTQVIYTDISRDGMLSDPNLEAFESLKKFRFDLVASGGVSDSKSLKKLNALGLHGAILGKALYEHKISLQEGAQAVEMPTLLTKRIIPCLDVKEGRVVKGVHFESLRDAGDPVELGKRYSDEEADELVFLDITASYENRDTLVELVKRVAQEIFIPFTVGGGIKSIDEIRRILHSGADKVSLNTSAIQNPTLISEASKIFGSQCVVVAIDAKKIFDTYKVFIKGGREETELEVVSWAKEVERLGAGEILLTSMDRDGTKQGFDLQLLRNVSTAVNIPVIASGGAGSLEDLKRGLIVGKADAVLAASLFHYEETSIQKVKEYLRNAGLRVRL